MIETAPIADVPAPAGRLHARGVVSGVVRVLAWALLAVTLAALAVILIAPRVWGWEYGAVSSTSMEPALPEGSIAVFAPVGAADIRTGDIILFDLSGTRVVHRVASITADGRLVTRGDANDRADPEPVLPGDVKGRLLFSVPHAGRLARTVEGADQRYVWSAGAALFVLLAAITGRRVTRSRATPYLRGDGGRIFSHRRNQIEDTNVRFPRRKPDTPLAVKERMTVVAAQFHPEPMPVAADPFEPADIPYNWGAPRSDDAPPPPLFPVEEPAPPQAAAPEPAPAPLPVLARDIPLRGQFSGADSRADRLVKQVRNEVEQLKKTLDSLSLDRDELMQLDIDALVADPDAALTLPPTLLVQALLELAGENERLREELSEERAKSRKLRRRLTSLRRDDAARRSRLDTLEEVIAALHANLEDLRGDRDHAAIVPAATPQALRPGAGQLPQASSGPVNRE